MANHFGKRLIVRVAPESKNRKKRITQGKVYEYDGLCIIDDNGVNMAPTFQVDGKVYWRYLEIGEYDLLMFKYGNAVGEVLPEYKKTDEQEKTTEISIQSGFYSSEDIAKLVDEINKQVNDSYSYRIKIPKTKFIPLGQEYIDPDSFIMPTLEQTFRDCPKAVEYDYIKTSTGEKKMATEVKNVTLINSVNADEYGINELISLIKAEEERIEVLDTVKSNSKAIDALREKHKNTIKQLTDILDKREL